MSRRDCQVITLEGEGVCFEPGVQNTNIQLYAIGFFCCMMAEFTYG